MKFTEFACIFNILLFSTGVRDSCRYSYDQDWLKIGQPAQFSFLSNPEDEDKCLTIQATNSLIADVHNINNVLHSVRQKIKAVK